MNWTIWVKGLAAAVVSGAAGGVMTAFAAMGIDPQHFNLAGGLRHTLALAGSAAAISALIGAAGYLKQSPVPNGVAPEAHPPGAEK